MPKSQRLGEAPTARPVLGLWCPLPTWGTGSQAEALVPRPHPLAASEGLGAGGVGHVGGWLQRVAGEHVGLPQDGQVHQHLQQPAHGELQGRRVQQEVCRLEGVATRPHEDHLDAAETYKQSGVTDWGQGSQVRVRGLNPGVSQGTCQTPAHPPVLAVKPPHAWPQG